MQLARNILGALGMTLLILGAVASLQDAERGDALGLRLFPALFLHLHHPLIRGGDFPPLLSQAGIAAVYFVPGVAVLCLAVVLHRRSQAAAEHRDHGA
jgi:hypothetical protein